MVSARRGDVAERIDCGPGKDIAIVDHADLVTNCETVERPLSGRRRLGGKAAVARTAITWPRIVGRWAKASSDYEYWAWYDHPQLKHDPLTCWTGAREFQPSIVAAVSGIDPGSLLHSLRYAKIQFRWSAIDPNEGSARSQIAKRSPRTFRTTSRYDSWWEAKHPRISIGQGLSNTLGVAFVQYRVSWHTDSVVDRRIARTRWYTLGVCHYTSFTGA
jgi:hypothetical protein